MGLHLDLKPAGGGGGFAVFGIVRDKSCGKNAAALDKDL